MYCMRFAPRTTSQTLSEKGAKNGAQDRPIDFSLRISGYPFLGPDLVTVYSY